MDVSNDYIARLRNLHVLLALDTIKVHNDAVTGTTLAQRSSDKIRGAFNMVDDTLGLDTRGANKGILEDGVKGAILNGIGKKK